MSNGSLPLTDERRQELLKVCQDMIGTCRSIDTVLDAHGLTESCELSVAELGYIDDQVAQCSGCGWWFEVHEITYPESGEATCPDCAPEEDEEH